jgi:hypothetical protein
MPLPPTWRTRVPLFVNPLETCGAWLALAAARCHQHNFQFKFTDAGKHPEQGGTIEGIGMYLRINLMYADSFLLGCGAMWLGR